MTFIMVKSVSEWHINWGKERMDKRKCEDKKRMSWERSHSPTQDCYTEHYIDWDDYFPSGHHGWWGNYYCTVQSKIRGKQKRNVGKIKMIVNHTMIIHPLPLIIIIVLFWKMFCRWMKKWRDALYVKIGERWNPWWSGVWWWWRNRSSNQKDAIYIPAWIAYLAEYIITMHVCIQDMRGKIISDVHLVVLWLQHEPKHDQE